MARRHRPTGVSTGGRKPQNRPKGRRARSPDPTGKSHPKGRQARALAQGGKGSDGQPTPRSPTGPAVAPRPRNE
eukprot:11549855-Alexandrium_andersonii.AAC.2